MVWLIIHFSDTLPKNDLRFWRDRKYPTNVYSFLKTSAYFRYWQCANRIRFWVIMYFTICTHRSLHGNDTNTYCFYTNTTVYNPGSKISYPVHVNPRFVLNLNLRFTLIMPVPRLNALDSKPNAMNMRDHPSPAWESFAWPALYATVVCRRGYPVENKRFML